MVHKRPFALSMGPFVLSSEAYRRERTEDYEAFNTAYGLLRAGLLRANGCWIPRATNGVSAYSLTPVCNAATPALRLK